jgi:hypothetical protein
VLVLPGSPGEDGDALVAAWKAARDDASRAYAGWRGGGGTEEFTVYCAAADREQAAADALASRAMERRSRWHQRRKRESR